jgi:hypothetical protein
MTKGRTAPLFAMLLLAACHGDSNQAPQVSVAQQAKTQAAVKHGPTPDELTTGMVEAVTLDKSAVPVDVKFDLPERPVMGHPLEIVIAVMPHVAGSAALQITGSDGLQLAPGVGTVQIPAVEPTQAYRVTIATTPTAEGVQLLGLSVSLTHDDTTETRSFSVPVIVAPGDAAATISKR